MDHPNILSDVYNIVNILGSSIEDQKLYLESIDLSGEFAELLHEFDSAYEGILSNRADMEKVLSHSNFEILKEISLNINAIENDSNIWPYDFQNSIYWEDIRGLAKDFSETQ